MNNKINKLKEQISKEKIKDLYIAQNLSKAEVAQFLNITLHSLSNLFKEYKIVKDQNTILALRKQTCLDKYGVDNPSKSEQIKNKIIEVNQGRYHANSYTATEEGKAQIKATKKERYDNENYNNIEKGKLTKKVKYNNENYNNRKKYKNTMLKNYNVNNGFKLIKTKNNYIDSLFNNKEYSKDFKKLFTNRESSIKYLEGKNLSYFDLSSLFNAPYYTIQQWATRLNLKDYINFKFEGKSHYEDEIINYIKSLGIYNIIRKDTMILHNSEIDIYLPDYKIGIEFNGTYWHSDLFKTQKYHLEKSLKAQEVGIRLLHIYQYEWDDVNKINVIKALIRSALNINIKKIFARNCDVRLINNKEAKELNDKNHVQGHRNAKITYGLFYKNKLVQLMSFSKHRKYEWEIIRSCSEENILVVGGVSKLFSHFIKDNNPKEIFSYCDFNKFTGKSYENLGMSFIGYTGPDMKYLIRNQVVNRQPNRYKEIKKLVDARIYGAGSKKYLWQSIK